MKKYAKPQMMAKNAPTGSYAAGCPTYGTGSDSLLKSFLFPEGKGGCKKCERTK